MTPSTMSSSLTSASQRTRKLAFGLFAVVLLLVTLGATAYWFLIASRYVSTDNAYSAVELAAVSPAVDGIVQTITVVDTQSVKAGDILVILDDTDARLALAQAKPSWDRPSAGSVVIMPMAKDWPRRSRPGKRYSARWRRQLMQDRPGRSGTRHAGLSTPAGAGKLRSVSGEELSNARTLQATAKANLAAAEAAQAQSKADRLSVVAARKPMLPRPNTQRSTTIRKRRWPAPNATGHASICNAPSFAPQRWGDCPPPGTTGPASPDWRHPDVHCAATRDACGCQLQRG